MTTANKKKVMTLDGVEGWKDEKFAFADHPLDNWNSMPEFYASDSDTHAIITFKFTSDDDIRKFAESAKVKITGNTKELWYPYTDISHEQYTRFVSDRSEANMPKYPIYIPSKGRWDVRFTSDALIKIGCKHYMIVEESQYENYKATVDSNWVTLLILPQKYLDEYDTFDDFGATKSKGPGAARNFAWDHSISLGFKRHWVMDDNIKKFYRMLGAKRIIVNDGAIIRAMEDHADQYENVYMSGPHYKCFAVPTESLLPFIMNTRIYSCNLILNDIPYRWRGRYNEDTDLSLRILKDGHVTLQYYAFLADKMGTQTVKGGNSAEFYFKEGTMPKSQMLVDMHPDVAEIAFKFGRWHHEVNYRPFKRNRFIPVKNPYLNSDSEYGMKLHIFEKPTKDVKNVGKYVAKKKQAHDAYYNPEGVVENATSERFIKVRFKTKDDLDLFIVNTGLNVTSKTKTYNYSSSSLADFL